MDQFHEPYSASILSFAGTLRKARPHSPHGPLAFHRRLKDVPAFIASTIGIRKSCRAATISSSDASPARSLTRCTKARHWFCFTSSLANSFVSATEAAAGSGVRITGQILGVIPIEPGKADKALGSYALSNKTSSQTAAGTITSSQSRGSKSSSRF
jgi:hypothetical protein